eukprot:scaffold3656_cov254-Pinguiococcus_pyrenoidosus.AAC.10
MKAPAASRRIYDIYVYIYPYNMCVREARFFFARSTGAAQLAREPRPGLFFGPAFFVFVSIPEPSPKLLAFARNRRIGSTQKE